MSKKISFSLIAFIFFIVCIAKVNGQYPVKPSPAIISDTETSDILKIDSKQNYEILWTETFSDGFPADWLNVNLNGFCAFQHSVSPPQGPFSVDVPAINSTTAANGFIILDSDLCNYDNFINDDPYEFVDAYVQTSAIDLSEHAKVGLRFEHFFRYCCDPGLVELKVLVSNNAIDWVSYDVSKGLAPNNISANPEITTLNITAVAGGKETVYIRFHKRGASQYFWMIDDVSIISLTDNDISIADIRHEGYTIIPAGVKEDIKLKANVRNIGAKAQTDIKLKVIINEYLDTLHSNVLPALNPSSDVLMEISESYVFPGKGFYNMVFKAVQLETDEYPENNIKESLVIVGDTVFARDMGVYSASNLVWPAMSETTITGNIFLPDNEAKATSVSVALHESTEADNTISFVVFEYSEPNVFTEISRSEPYEILVDDVNSIEGEAVWLTLSIDPVDLQPGIKYLAAVEYSSEEVAIAADKSVWQPENSSFSEVDGNWITESTTPMIRLNFGENEGECNVLAYFDVNHDFCEMGVGNILAIPINGTPPFTFEWNTDPVVEEALLENLVEGIYSVTITDAYNCFEPFEVEVESKLMEYDIEVIPSACEGDNGSIIVTPLTGQPPFSFSWSHDPELIDSVATGLAHTDPDDDDDVYVVTITDANGCSVEASVDVLSVEYLLISYETVSPVCLNNNGSIMLYLQNGTDSFTYSWSNDEDFNGPFQDELIAGTYFITVTDANECIGEVEVELNTHEIELIVLGDIIHAKCELENGAVLINVTNGHGEGPYTYEWSNEWEEKDLIDVGAGEYHVNITDDWGCTGYAEFLIENIGNALEIDVEVTNTTSCGENDGKIEIIDPNPNYSFLWDNSDTGPVLEDIPSGMYIVTVTDNSVSCYKDFGFFVSDDELPLMTFEKVNVSCNGYDDGRITINIPGGGFTFLWSTGSEESFVEDLAPDTYSVEIQSDICYAVFEFTITEPLVLEVETVEVSDPLCYNYDNGFIEVTAIGGTPIYQYTWDNQMTGSLITDLEAGTYNVLVTDLNSCEAEAGYTLINPQEIIVYGIVVNPDEGEDNGSIEVIVEGGVGQLTYEWDSGHEGHYITGLGPGEYTVTVTDENGCSAQETFELFTTSINDPDFADKILVYPNPANDFINLDFGILIGYDWQIKMYDIRGVVISEWNEPNVNTELRLNINHLKSGLYILQIASEFGKLEQLIVVN